MIPSLDRSKLDSGWFPSGGTDFDALDMCGISLGMSDRLRAGTGVIRSTDYDVARLLGRVHTLNEGSGRRFRLGIGTGGGTGRAAIDGLVELADGIRGGYPEKVKPTMSLRSPEAEDAPGGLRPRRRGPSSTSAPRNMPRG